MHLHVARRAIVIKMSLHVTMLMIYICLFMYTSMIAMTLFIGRLVLCRVPAQEKTAKWSDVLVCNKINYLHIHEYE